MQLARRTILPFEDPPVRVSPMPSKNTILDPLTCPTWDNALLRTPGHTFFHSSAWARVLAESYGYRPVYIGQWGGHGFRTLLPLLEIKSALTGRRAVSLPFTDYCDPLIAPETDAESVLEFALDQARNSGWAYLEVRSNAYPNQDPCASFFRHTLDLTAGKQEVFRRLRDSTRRNIRKAEKKGVETQISCSRDALDSFYHLHCLTRRRHGLPPQPFRFFRKLHEHVLSKDMGFLVLGAYQGRVIAGAMFLHFGGKALFKFGASDVAYQHMRPSNLVMWTGIEHCLGRDFRTLCLGRTDPGNQGLRQFKNGWGVAEDTIHYYRFARSPGSSRTSRFLNGNIRSSLFERLPIPLLRIAGTLLYRHFG